VTVEKGHGSRGGMMVTRSAITEQKGWRRKGLGGQFPFLQLNLSGCENLRRRREAEQRTVARPSPVYIKTKARPIQRLARTRRGIQKTKSEMAVPRTARACAMAAPRTARPVALTPRRDRWRLWRGKRATLRLRHNDRVKKKVRHVIRFRILFLFSLSLSYNRDRERGIPRNGSFSVKETGSEPPY
jgi:hypothetical protein